LRAALKMRGCLSYESAADIGIDQNSMKENAAETFAALMVLREGATEDNLAWIAATRSWGPFVAGEAEHWLADADLNALEAWRAHKNEIRALDLRSTFLYAMALAKTTALSFQDARRILLSYAYTTRRRWTIEESLVHAEEIARKENHSVLHRFAATYAASVASRLRPEEARAVLDSLGPDASLLGVGAAPAKPQPPARSRSAPIRGSEEGLR